MLEVCDLSHIMSSPAPWCLPSTKNSFYKLPSAKRKVSNPFSGPYHMLFRTFSIWNIPLPWSRVSLQYSEFFHLSGQVWSQNQDCWFWTSLTFQLTCLSPIHASSFSCSLVCKRPVGPLLCPLEVIFRGPSVKGLSGMCMQSKVIGFIIIMLFFINISIRMAVLSTILCFFIGKWSGH